MNANANPVSWFEIYVKDMPRAKAFYENTLGVKLEKLDTPASEVSEMYSFPMGKEHSYGATGALVKMENGPGGGAGGTLVYFECEDCAVEANKVKANGGKITKGKFSIKPHGFIALGTDTEGNMIGLHSMH